MKRHLTLWIAVMLVVFSPIISKTLQAQNTFVDGNFNQVASSGWARDIRSSTVLGPDWMSNDPNDPTRLIGQGWKRGLFVGNGPDPSAEVVSSIAPYTNVLEILRTGAGGAGEGGAIYQDVNIDVTKVESIALSADVRIDAQSLPGGGSGKAEYPIGLMVGWTDAAGIYHWDDGENFSHFVQAFYINPGNVISSSQQIPANTWKHYTSPNLKTLFPNIVRIDRVAVGFGGHDYQAYCDNLAVTSMQDVIVFSSNGDIWRVNQDGGDLQQITTDGGGKGGPSISPGGTKIAFGKQDAGLWVMNADGSSPTLLCGNGNYSKTSWSPDGSKILYMNVNVCNEDIWMANSDGSGCVPFIDDSVPGIDGPVTQAADWSINNIIIFNAHACGRCCNEGLLYAIKPDKTDLRQIGFGGWANWSPDGSKIVYDYCSNIYVANADGSNKTALTADGSSSDPRGYPCWSPDGTKIAFFRNNNIWTMNADGSNQQQITNGSFPDAMLDWGKITIITAVSALRQAVPERFELEQNYPNPFNPETTIEFNLPRSEKVNVHIYDVRGNLVRTLLDGEQELSGYYRLNWNGQDDRGKPVSSGVYFYRIQAGNFTQTKKMTLLH